MVDITYKKKETFANTTTKPNVASSALKGAVAGAVVGSVINKSKKKNIGKIMAITFGSLGGVILLAFIIMIIVGATKK